MATFTEQGQAMGNEDWRKSSFSAINGNCVEVATSKGGRVRVRDTKDEGAGPVLCFESDEWRAFINAVKWRGDLDLAT